MNAIVKKRAHIAGIDANKFRHMVCVLATEAANLDIPGRKPWSNPATAPFNRLPITITVPNGVADGHRES